MNNSTRKMYFSLFLTMLFMVSSIAQAKDSAIIVFDASGSMWGQIKGKAKIKIAQDVMETLVKDWNEDIELGLIAYGHREKGNCDDIEVLLPVASVDNKKILKIINKISPKGKTPISESLKQAAETLRYTEDSATVILISDGEETCNADPCVVSKELEEKGINFTTHVIGFDIKKNKKAREQLKCIAKNTGGQFYEAEDAASLKKALVEVKQVVVDPRPTVCKRYSEDAVNHERTNIEKECSFKGKHWSMNYTMHYDWCMAEAIDSASPKKEHQARVTDLNKCQKNKIKTVVVKTNIGSLQIINTISIVNIHNQKTEKRKGIWGSTDKQIRLPAGTYKLDFGNFFLKNVKISANETTTVDASEFVGWISITNTRNIVSIYDQNTGKRKGVWGSTDKQIQLPASTYKLDFGNFVLKNVKISANETTAVDASKFVGWISITNTRNIVSIYDQNTGKRKGVWGSTDKQIQLPGGTYKLDFGNFVLKNVKISANETTAVDASKFVGWISITNTRDIVNIYDQSTGKRKGVWGSTDKLIQLPVGMYHLKSKHFEVKDVVIEAGQKLVVKIE